ncbi:MAG: type II toxin-antitoxin system RelE/ParE family toxin [Myxococcaceae bacterium]|nr:type II toxin-antitoxin system RelE/ParE family toxin [Myxococcaceae bacterium]
MAKVLITARALTDLERLVDFLLDAGAEETARRAREQIVDAFRVLERHPLIGRPAQRGLRELVISFGRAGYVAVYRYRPEEDLILILAVRHQREVSNDG